MLAKQIFKKGKLCVLDISLANLVKYTEKGLKLTKRLKTAEKVVQQACGCVQHPQAGQNTQRATIVCHFSVEIHVLFFFPIPRSRISFLHHSVYL